MQPIQFIDNMNTVAKEQQSGFIRDLPLQAMLRNPDVGVLFDRRFDQVKLIANINAADAYWCQGMNVFGSNTAAITAVDALQGGVTLNPTGDNLGVVISGAIPAFQLDRSCRRFWFEAQVQVSAITDALADIFLGLIDSTAPTVNIPITTAGALADVNLLGFFAPETARTVAGTGGAIMNTVYKASGVAAVNVQTDAVALVAATWTRLGIRIDKDFSAFSPAAQFAVTFFQDGVPLATQKIIPSALGTDFPNNNRFRFCLAAMGSNAAPRTVSIRRVRVGQLILAEQGA